MATSLKRALQHLRHALAPHGGPSDEELLARFVAERDEPAFALLVRRHGPMVLGLCRRILRNPHDAEDAFQAAFLVLSCKAGAVVKREAVGGWLYRVAYRVALEARAANARRRAHEKQVQELPQPETPPAEPQDWRPLLDHELTHLPPKYRAAVVLCDLEGEPRKVAAQRLGVPEGTLSSRLVRARALLAGRLARRGLALSAPTVAGLFGGSASACPPPGLVAATVKAVALFTAGRAVAAGSISAEVAALTKGMMKAMLLTRLKAATGTMLTLAVLALGGHAFLQSALAQKTDSLLASGGGASRPAVAAPANLVFRAPAPGPVPLEKAKPAISPANAARVKKLKELPRDVWEIVWGPKPGQVSFLSWERPVEVLDSNTFRPIETIEAGRQLIHFAASGDGRRIAYCTNSTKVEVRDLRGGKVVMIETNNDQPKMAFSPNGKLLATGGYGNDAKLWDAGSGRFVRSLPAGEKGGLTAVFSPNGKLLAVGNRNDITSVYEVATGKRLYTLPEQRSQELKFSPDGRTLAVAYVDGRIGLWNVADGKLLRERKTGATEVYTVDWSPRGDVLATAGRNGKITLWAPGDLSVLKELDGPEWVIRVRFSPDGSRLLSAGGGALAGQVRKVLVWGLDP
jgi:RNA polymerase sigma factor (sigma-70 family)